MKIAFDENERARNHAGVVAEQKPSERGKQRGHVNETRAADSALAHRGQGRSSSSASPSRSIPTLKISGSQHIPIRMCSGDSKNRPGTTAVSYFSSNQPQNFSTSAFRSRGNEVVPNFVGTTSISARLLKNSCSVRRFVSNIALARAPIVDSFFIARTLKRSITFGALAAKISSSRLIFSASSASARIQPQRSPLKP